jgi:L-fuconolactonase
VFVQTQHDVAENRWVLEMAKQHDFIAGVVGWVDLQSDHCEEQLLEFVNHPKFVGIRHITHDEPDDDFITRPAVLSGLKVLERHQVPFDLLFYTRHFKHAVTVARHAPELPLVVDHLAKPRIKEGIIDGWIDDLRAAAECENIYCKLSGMVTEADWQHWKVADLRPYVEAALEAFGPERLMFGTDWPVCELAASYEQVHAALCELIAPLTPTEKAQILGETAKNFYNL